MIKYFTAVGKLNYKELKEEGFVECECNFNHVVQAENDDEAHEKVIAYYSDKGDYYERFEVLEIEIFDFIS